MLERIDILVKWFLRIIAGIYLLILTLIIAFYPWTHGLEVALANIVIWIFIMPFDPGTALASAASGLPVFFTYVFWTFWIVTGTRWITIGKHFWQ